MTATAFMPVLILPPMTWLRLQEEAINLFALSEEGGRVSLRRLVI